MRWTDPFPQLLDIAKALNELIRAHNESRLSDDAERSEAAAESKSGTGDN